MARVGPLTDIPIERDSIGAMSVTSPMDRFKPYIYRGTGFDQFPETETPVSRRATKKVKPKPKPKPKARRRRKPKPRPAPKPRSPYDWGTPHRWPRYQPPPRPPVRPAEGWKPLAGADLDALLEED